MAKKMKRRPAVFLDRDGTLIHDADYLSRPSQVRFFPDTVKALKLLKKAGYRLFVVSNQSGVARGYFTEGSVRRVQAHLRARLRARGVRLDGLFYCPHYPGGKVKSLGHACTCRKPSPGMVRQAAKRFPLDLKGSFVVGDKMDDLILARKAGLAGSVLVRTGKGRESAKRLAAHPLKDAVTAPGLYAAALWIASFPSSAPGRPSFAEAAPGKPLSGRPKRKHE